MSVRSQSSMEALPFGKVTKWRTTYIDPVNGHIFCQLSEPSVAAKYERMEEGIKFIVQSNMLQKRILDPIIGELCLGQSSIDKVWYRSQIIYVDKKIQLVEVYFLDIGIYDFVSFDSLRDLPSQFFEMPAFAHECMLADIEPVLYNNKWNENAIELIKNLILDKEVAGTAIRLYNRNILVLKLYTNIEAIVTLAEQLISLGFALPKQLKSATESVSYVKQVSSNSSSNSIPGSVKSVRSVIPIFPEICPQKRIDVYVVFFQSLNEFYCQSTSSKEKLISLQEKLQCGYVKNSLAIFEINQPCCAKFSEDNQWYRGLIKNTQKNTCDIFFVDYGNTEAINKTDIRELDTDFCAMPSMAFRCSLSGIKPLETEIRFSEEANCFFQKLAFTEYSLSALIMHVSEQSTEVILYDNKNNPINQILVNEKLVEAAGVSTLEKVNHEKMNQSLSSHSIGFESNVESLISYVLPNIDIGKEETVCIITSFSLNKFFVHLSHSSDKLLRLMSDIRLVYKNSKNIDLLANPIVGLQCVTTFSEDDEYYRAEIQKVDKYECQVFFVDYGNSESKALNELKPLRKEFIKLPRQAIECRLAGIEPLNGAHVYSQAACEKFEELTMDKELQMNVVDFSNGAYSVELSESSNGYNVINQLISSGLVVKTTPKKDYGRVVSIGSNYKELKIDVNSYFDVVPVNVVDPNLFYCHVFQNAMEFKKLTETMNEFYQSKDFVNQNVSWQEKMPCVALFHEDQTWCRASIVSVNSDILEVLFVDFGNTGTVSKANVFPIYEEFMKLPKQVFSCSLVDILPVKGSWHREAITNFQSFVLDKHLGAFVKEKCNHLYSIVLYDTRSSPEINLSQWLLQNNYAVTSDCSISNFEPSNIENIYVSAVVSSTELYAQLVRMKNGLNEVMTNIDQFYSSLKPSEMCITPIIGQYCCAKFTEDDGWYRAVVEEFNGSIFGVLYIDYGNREFLPMDRIKRLDSSFLTIPKYALLCQVPNSYELLDKVLSVEFITKSAPFKIKLNKTDHKETLNKNTISLSSIVELPPINITVGFYEAICYAVESATKINCQLLKFSNDIDRIMNEIANIADSEPKLPNPVVGQLCLAKYRVDESWYRGRVVATDNNVVVEFIDYGNQDVVPLKDVKVLPAKFFSVPQAYVSVVLHDVSLLDIDAIATKKWLEESFIESTLQLEVQEIVNPTTVSAYVYENDKTEHINDRVYELHALPEDISNPIQEQHVVLSPIFIPDLKQTGNASLPPNNIAVGSYEAICYAVESATKINCQLLKFSNDIDRIMNEIANIADSEPMLPNPVVGQLCLAKYCVDESWYRGRILATENNIVVEFIDYGNQDVVPLNDVKVLPKKFLNVPQAYVSVILHDVSLLDIDVVTTKKWLEESFIESTLQLEVQEIVNPTTVSAYVYENDKTEHINDQVYELHALPEDISNPIQEQHVVLSPIFIPDLKQTGNASLPPMNIAVGSYEAICYAVESATKINCQLLNFLNDIDRIMIEIGIIADSTPVLPNPAIGQLCLAKYCVDKSWYRGRIVATENNIVVEFIDYGNQDVVPLNDIKILPAKFLNVPQAYVSVILHDVSLLDIDTIATKKWLEESFIESTLQLEVQEVVNPTTVSAYVYENNKTEHINDRVYELHALPEDVSNPIQEQHVVLSPTISDLTQSSNISLPPINIAVGSYKAICYAVESATKINCQLLKFSNDIDRIMIEIAVFADSAPVLLNPVIGQLCLAKYRVDESWYRGRVIATDNNVVVEFIDYGNQDVVSLNEIKVLPPKFLNVPQAYVSVILHDVSLLDIDTIATKKWLEESFIESTLQLEVQEVVNPTTVSAYVYENDKTEHINDRVYELHALTEDSSTSLQEQHVVLASTLIPDLTRTSNISLPPMNIAVGSYEAICYAVESATKINCQLLKFSNDIDRIMNEIANIADSVPMLPNPVVGQLCLAKYSVDELWYRGRVVVVGKDIVVEFIDFGNNDVVPSEDVKVLPEKFVNIPQAYVSVVLHDVSLLDIDVVTTKKWLEESFIEAVFQVHVQEVMDNSTVSAYVYENGSSKHINDLIYELYAYS